jgi:ketosteroid isomerase-like protein
MFDSAARHAVRCFRSAPRSLALLLLAVACGGPESSERAVETLVRDHARAWMTGDTALVRSILHEDALLAYPRRRVDRNTWVAELAAFHEQNVDTRIYVHRIIVDGETFAVEWQFATTDRSTGERTAVGDAIIGEVRDGRISLWKEYLDGRIFALQRAGELPLDEGLEPFPWPETP